MQHFRITHHTADRVGTTYVHHILCTINAHINNDNTTNNTRVSIKALIFTAGKFTNLVQAGSGKQTCQVEGSLVLSANVSSLKWLQGSLTAQLAHSLLPFYWSLSRHHQVIDPTYMSVWQHLSTNRYVLHFVKHCIIIRWNSRSTKRVMDGRVGW